VLAGSGTVSYSWSDGVVDGVTFNPTVTNTYTVTGTSAEGCQNTDDVEVLVNELPDVLFEADTTQGCIPLEVNFSNTTTGFSESCTYTIDDETELLGCDVTYTFTEVRCYDITLEVMNGNGCVNSSTISDYICIEEYPIAAFSFEPKDLTNVINQAYFSNESTGATTYDWDFGDGASSEQINPSHVYNTTDGPEDYTVQLIAYSNFGCIDIATGVIPVTEELVYYIPNTFTPDGDEYNETFKPVFTSGLDPQDYTLLIFNRWGEVIFESNDADIGWDGTFGATSEEIVKDGTYIWKIEFKTKYTDERKVEMGHVNVLR
jgi:gliding motility-associated-like protein